MTVIRHVWSVICSQSMINKESNNISLIEVIEEMSLVPREDIAEPIIAIPIPLAWVTLWTRAEANKPSRGHAKDIVLDPSGQTIWEHEYEVDVSKKQRTRLKRILGGMPVPRSGQYRFLTQVKDEERDTWNLVSDVPLEISIKSTKIKGQS